ncbi:MAG: hypothetical protein AAEJ43_06845 [Gammaproteobacteria bacterium]
MRKYVFAIALLVSAQMAGSDEVSDPGITRSPGDMTVEERIQMMKKARGYDACVYNKAMAQVDDEGDIRLVADMAMGQCEPHLEDLGSMIQGWGFNPHFARGFTGNVRNRAARKILPELAVRKSR